MTIPEIPLIDVFSSGGALKSPWLRRLPAQPRLPDAGRPLPPGPYWTSTRFPVSEEIGIEDVEERRLRSARLGDGASVLRSVVVL